MRYSLPALLLIASLTSFSTAVAEEDLFSDIAIEAVFSDSNKESATATTPANGSKVARIAGVGPLENLLKRGGLTTKRGDGKTLTTTVSHVGLSFPVTLRVAVDRNLIEISLPMKTLTEGKTLTSTRLLELIATDTELPGASFRYGTEDKTMQLRYTVSNRGLTPGRLVSVLRSMVELVERRQATQPTTASTASGNSGSTLPVGSWLAKIGTNEAFAVQFSQEGAFKLVHVKAGKSTTSSGTATLSGNQLSLKPKTGGTLSGTLQNQTAEGFELVLGSQTMKFKKAQ